MARIVVDPITRIEGHLRIEAEIEGGTIRMLEFRHHVPWH
jgi:Ni,Fe-hydrogenase I large subunit